jgi:hypothetical protein
MRLYGNGMLVKKCMLKRGELKEPGCGKSHNILTIANAINPVKSRRMKYTCKE